MVMADNEAGDGHNEVKSPWKTPAIDGEKVGDAPVMGTQSWPDLGGNQQTPQNNNPQVAADVCAPAALHPSVEQRAAGQPKSNGSGNPNASYKHSSARHQKSDSKRNPNAGPRFPIPLPYYQPPVPAVFHPMVPPPHIAVPGPGYAYHPVPGPFPGIDPQLVKSGSETTMQAFGPPVQGVDASRNMQLPPRGDPNAYPANFSNRRPNVQEPGGHFNPGWNHQRAFNPREPIPMQPGVGPRSFARPPFFGPAPGFMIGPGYPGALCYVPIAPPGSIRGPHSPRFVPYPISPEAAVLPPEMVKRMSTDIPFILDALQSSSTVEVQGDKIRRRDEWSKWIPVGSTTTLSSEAQATQYQPKENVTDSCGNDLNEDNSKDICEENFNIPLESGSLDHVPAEGNHAEVMYKSNRKHAAVQVQLDGEKRAFSGGNGNLNRKLTVDSNIKFSDIDQLQGIDRIRFNYHRTESVELSPDVIVQNVADLSNDFAHTFMLDEELELEQKTTKTLSAFNRLDEEEDDMVNDQDVQRLVIVTQLMPNSGITEGSKTGAKDSKAISSELAAMINDGLVFYEQELKTKRSSRRKNNSNYENKDGNPRSPRGALGVSNLKTGENAAGSSNLEESGGSSSRRKQNKGFSKQQSFHKQRFFSGNSKNHGASRNSIAIISESPPSNSVGYFFGSTPPDIHGPRQPSKLSCSPHGTLSSSPPVGSLPKSFPPFQHPSHQLLEENGFKQQK
ncbi:La-related 1 [Gossypium australe]|nr:La-related 1 [Gossypium australe]